jgi:hypothetical protein
MMQSFISGTLFTRHPRLRGDDDNGARMEKGNVLRKY